ncbi:hypothetical protein BGZ63DRAFT_447367 [Mariannaea sp. PMI_226]|nr:hypothetical protein BGZ63DRAFT_447367 [Mariannaea sp. PMI_226]
MASHKCKNILTKLQEQICFRRIVQKLRNRDCPIIRLSPESMIALADRLPMHSQVLLAQTCRSLRQVLYSLHKTGLGLDREETLELLTCLARDMPERWVCERCLTMHICRQSDIPRARGYRSCPRHSDLTTYKTGRIHFFHHHIQLALKYARLKRISAIQHQYLDAVLAVHTVPSDGTLSWETGVSATHSLRPKIVRGNFLIKSKIHFNKGPQEVLPGNLRYWPICKHQRLMSLRSLCDQPQMLLRPLKPEYALLEMILAALAAEGNDEVHLSCPLCPTDFSVQISPRRVTLRIWVDLGRESSPLDELWKVRAGKDESSIFRVPNEEPGRVRSLYESRRGRTARPKMGPSDVEEARKAEMDAMLLNTAFWCAMV